MLCSWDNRLWEKFFTIYHHPGDRIPGEVPAKGEVTDPGPTYETYDAKLPSDYEQLSATPAEPKPGRRPGSPRDTDETGVTMPPTSGH